MNGLSLIRKQSGFSLTEMSELLGVTRQMVNAWENGTKKIPAKRGQQLAEYFGIDVKYFGELNDEMKMDLLGKAMFRFSTERGMRYKYKPENEEECWNCCFLSERAHTIDEELLHTTQENRRVIERVKNCFQHGDPMNYRNTVSAGLRARSVYDRIAAAFENCFTQKAGERMIYWHLLEDIAEAIISGMDVRGEFEEVDRLFLQNHQDFAARFSEMIREELNMRLDEVRKNNSPGSDPEDTEERDEQNLTFREKIEQVEKAYREFRTEHPEIPEVWYRI